MNTNFQDNQTKNGTFDHDAPKVDAQQALCSNCKKLFTPSEAPFRAAMRRNSSQANVDTKGAKHGIGQLPRGSTPGFDAASKASNSKRDNANSAAKLDKDDTGNQNPHAPHLAPESIFGAGGGNEAAEKGAEIRSSLTNYLTSKLVRQTGIEGVQVKVDRPVPPLFARAGRVGKGNIRPLIRAAYTRN